MALQVDIVTPQRSAWSGSAAQVVLPALEGQLGVLPEHDRLLALLVPGVATVITSGGTERYVLGFGFAEIGPDRVTVLTDACDLVSQVDREAARRELTAAEAEMSLHNFTTERYRIASDRARAARARLEA